MNNYDKLAYRVDTYEGDKTQFKNQCALFSDSLDYYDGSTTTEYVVHNSNCVKSENAKEFNGDSYNINEKVIYRGEGKVTKIPRYLSNYTGKFYSDSDDLSYYGTVKPYDLCDNNKIYKTTTSSDAVMDLGLNNFKCMRLGEFTNKYIIEHEEDEESYFFGFERYYGYTIFETLEQWNKAYEEVFGEEYDYSDELVSFNEWCRQIVLRNALQDKYDGIDYSDEDGMQQYQIWNLDVIKSYDGQVESLNHNINEGKEPTKEEVLNDIDRTFGQDGVYMWSTFILPNGHFLNPDNGDDYWEDIDASPDYEHSDFIYYEYNPYGEVLFDDCIKMNVTIPYLILPEKLTLEQQNSLRKIFYNSSDLNVENGIDELSDWCGVNENKIFQMKRPIIIDGPFGTTVIDLDLYSPNEMIKIINTAYAKGFIDNLYESLNEETQEEYFKNSKIRDEQGNLLVCYHGTNQPGFKEFNPSNASSQFGKYKFGNANVNYFTTDKKSATSYTNIGIEENGNVYACYLNVVNPFIVDNKSLASVKSSFNIKDDRIRQKQMNLFDNLWNKYGGMYPNENDLDNINNTLRKLNFEIRPSSERKDNTNYTTEKGYYDLYTLGNNSLYGAERPVMYAYTLEELFDDDMYDEVKETIIGYDEDDYYLSTDDIVRYVLAMNEEDGTNYDGIIISDIVDSKDMFALAGTDVITLKSSNQIKLIDNENPTSSNRIDEDDINIPPTNKNPLESKKQGNTKVLEESEDNIYYRGYDSRYGVFDSDNKYGQLYTWITDEPEYALEYTKNNKYGKVAKVRITCSDKEIGGVFDLPEDVDYYDPGDEGFQEYIIDQGLKGYGFEAGDYEDFCICISKDCIEVIDPDVEINELREEVFLTEKIVKKGNKWQVQSEKGRNMGTYGTKEEAEKRLKQIEYFKHLDEQSLIEDGNYAQLYHKTSLDSAIKILKDDTLKVGGNYVYNIKNGPCTCFSRDLSFIKSMPGREYVIFVVDKDKLTNNYKLMPISDNKNNFFGSTKARYSGNSKAEEICMKDITNFSQYVDEILIPNNCYDKFIDAIEKTPIKITKLTDGLVESYILNEKTRAELINKSKNADRYKDQSKGKNRYERRLKSRIANSVAQYNKIDMDAFFKRDVLTVGIDVQGETNNYVVTMKFNGVLNDIAREVKANKGKLEFKIIARAMSRAYNNDNIKLHCSCPDWKYRQAYWADKGGYGTQYEPRPSDITNPNDTKGGGCKHSLLVMSNLDWMMKVSSVINNYIKYCQKNLQKNYADYIFPKVYGMPYDKAIQLSLFDDGLLPSDQALLTKVASTNLKDKDVKGRWTQGNKYRFQKTNPEQEVKPEPTDGQKTIFDDEEDEKEYKVEKGRYGGTVKTYRVSPDRNNLGRFAPGNTVSRKKPLGPERPKLGTEIKKQIVPNNDNGEEK